MISQNLHEHYTHVYPVAIFDGLPSRRVRGAGKQGWCANRAFETISKGGRVWIKTDGSFPKERFLKLVLDVSVFRQTDSGGADEIHTKKGAQYQNGIGFFGSYSFSQTVGLWLEKGPKEGAALLSPFISTEGFTFSPEEYLDLSERLQVALRRYERLPSVSNGLEDLNTGFFRHRSLEESENFISERLAEYIRRGASLQRDFLLAINRHARSKASERRQLLRMRLARLEAMEQELKAAVSVTGRHRKKSVSETAESWRSYISEFHGRGTEEGDEGSPEQLRTVLAKEREAVQEGFLLMSRELKTDGMSLSALTIQPEHGTVDELKELENALNDLLSEVDEAGLYQLPLRLSDAATTPRQLRQLNSLLDKLRNTQHHLRELPLFYDRQHFWYAQPAHLRRLLAPLLSLPPEDWEAAFSGWYFDRCLEREKRPERFFRPVGELAGPRPETDLPAPDYAENLVFLSPESEWPTTCGPEDLLIDLSGYNEPKSEVKTPWLAAVPLSDESAMHVAVNGYRNPVLVFSQSFHPLHPPLWKVRPVATAPSGFAGGILVQDAEEGDWLPLADWKGSSTEKLNIFFPDEFAPDDENIFLDKWESLIAAAPGITFFHTLSPNAITQGLLSDGVNGYFLRSVLLRAAEAAELEPFDREALVALGREVRIRCGLPEPGPHPLAVQFGKLLSARLSRYFLETHVRWRDTFLPLVLQSPEGKKTVLLPDGRLPGLADDVVEAARQRELATAGFRILSLNALSVWENLEGELDRMVKSVKQ